MGYTYLSTGTKCSLCGRRLQFAASSRSKCDRNINVLFWKPNNTNIPPALRTCIWIRLLNPKFKYRNMLNHCLLSRKVKFRLWNFKSHHRHNHRF